MFMFIIGSIMYPITNIISVNDGRFISELFIGYNSVGISSTAHTPSSALFLIFGYFNDDTMSNAIIVIITSIM